MTPKAFSTYVMSKSSALPPDAKTLEELATAFDTDAVLRRCNADTLAFLNGIFTAEEATTLIVNASNRKLNFMTRKAGRHNTWRGDTK